MANLLSGQIIAIGQTQTIASKNGGNPLVKREFVIRTLRFNPNDGTPELSERNTPILEINGQDNVTVLDGFRPGDVVKVEFTIEGRSYEDQNHQVKYFNSVRAYRVEKLNVRLPQQATASQKPAQPVQSQASQQQSQGQQSLNNGGLAF